MRKYLWLSVVWVMLLTGCGGRGQEEEVLKQPPVLSLMADQQVLEVAVGTYSWNYDNGDGTSTGIEACGVHPLDETVLWPVLNLVGETVQMEFAVAPDEIAVCCWNETVFGDTSAPSEEISVKGNRFQLRDTAAAYQITATWKNSERYGGTANYVFYTDDSCTDAAVEAKPVIYLYPKEPMEVWVELDYTGELTCTYPAYNGGWHVTAEPDGTLTDTETGREYSYLFWEGVSDVIYDMSKGYVVRGEDTAEFLQETLEKMGLLPEEYNEFIVYWLPRMQDNAYNLISFQTDAYTEHAELKITPQPDSILRIFMVYQALEEVLSVETPEIENFERNGFTVVEWGGAELTDQQKQ